jgi:hypothetical protein
MKLSRAKIACLLAYAVMVSVVVWLMFYARNNVLTTFSTPEARQQWEEWRDKAWEQANEKEREKLGPRPEKTSDQPLGKKPKEKETVERKIPRSQEPPALVLMRDHFASCLVMVLLICSTIFGAFIFFLQGALAPAPKIPAAP